MHSCSVFPTLFSVYQLLYYMSHRSHTHILVLGGLVEPCLSCLPTSLLSDILLSVKLPPHIHIFFRAKFLNTLCFETICGNKIVNFFVFKNIPKIHKGSWKRGFLQGSSIGLLQHVGWPGLVYYPGTAHLYSNIYSLLKAIIPFITLSHSVFSGYCLTVQNLSSHFP